MPKLFFIRKFSRIIKFFIFNSFSKICNYTDYAKLKMRNYTNYANEILLA
jgi:hypothetical protein